MMTFLLTSVNVTANQPPVAKALPEGTVITAGQQACFSANASYDPDGWIVNYTWYSPGGYPYMGWGIDYCAVYMNEGFYWVTLEVLDDGGLNDTDDVWVDVKDPTPGDKSPHIHVTNPDVVCDGRQSIAPKPDKHQLR
jgi:hypothetical protein